MSAYHTPSRFRSQTGALFIVACALLLLTGCDIGRWQVINDKDGRVLRLDRWRGDLTRIDGDRLIKIKEPVQPILRAFEWPEVDLSALSHAKASAKTVWRSGELHYRFGVAPTPVPTQVDKTLGHFTLRFFDENGFHIFAISVPIERMNRMIGENGAVVGLEINDAVPVTVDEYALAKRWNVAWHLEAKK